MAITNKPQFKQGKNVEAFLDDYFRWLGWTIQPTTMHEERALHLGDRHYSKDGQFYLVEYKSGLQSAYTGNIFLETVSVDTHNVPGWVYTCQADFIFYAALLNQIILIFRPCRLREAMDVLKRRFKEVATSHQQNDGYNTHGLLVPLTYARAYLADKVIEI